MENTGYPQRTVTCRLFQHKNEADLYLVCILEEQMNSFETQYAGQYRVQGDILEQIRNYLQNQKINVTIEGSSSEAQEVSAGVPQGSILGPLLFLIYVNDIVNNLHGTPFLYADDTAIMMPINNLNPNVSFELINQDLNQLYAWATNWFMCFNPTKTVYMIVTTKRQKPNYPVPQMNNKSLNEVEQHKHLGVTISSNLTWDNHIDTVVRKANSIIGQLWSLNRHIPRKALEDIYLTFARPILEYGCTIYDNGSASLKKRLEDTQRRAAIACTRAYCHTKHETLLAELGWESLDTRRTFLKLSMFYKIINNHTPQYLRTLIPTPVNHQYNLRNNLIPQIPTRLSCFKNSYIPNSIAKWNSLDTEIKERPTYSSFKHALKRQLYHNHRSSLRSYGYGNGQVNHARIRMGLSGLNQQRFRYNFIDYQSCDKCHHYREDPAHYFLQCPRYSNQRQNMLDQLALVLNLDAIIIDANLLLTGSEDPEMDNKHLFKIVQEYITKTQRFVQQSCRIQFNLCIDSNLQ